MYLVTATEMQEMDRKTIEEFGVPGRALMENAGRGAVRFFLEQFPRMAASGAKVGVVAGRGNNGGDGFVMARYLHQKGLRATVFLLSEQSRVKGDAAANLKLLHPLNVPVTELPDAGAFAAHRSALRHQDVWIDAILGTGLNADVKGYFQEVITFINDSRKPVFSVDIPSGLNSETGQVQGACIRAAATSTFAFAKAGHFLYPGADHTGRLDIVDIGIPHHIAAAVGPKQFLLTPENVAARFRPRPSDAHKGHAGHLMVVAGSPGKTGAAAMTAMSAMRVGAGLVTLGVPSGLNSVLEGQVLEAMTLPLPEDGDGMLHRDALEKILAELPGKKCLALGPGIGVSESVRFLVRELVEKSPVPVVIDADGLNCLVGHTDILNKAGAPVVLTPHPGEMARLTGLTAADIQKDRIGCAREFASAHGVCVVLKGAATVIAWPAGRADVNPTGNPGMASGGMGDVLTGVIAGLITQGVAPEAAAGAGAYLHGMAADALVESMGPVGFLASDVMNALPGQIRRLQEAT